MKLPNREFADIPQTKLIDYLLSENHATGRSKATFFRNLGFDELNHLVLKKALYDIAQKEEIKQIVPSVYGIKYVIDGELFSPTAKAMKIRTIWIIEKDQDIPRFVTAYPL